jgi:DNA invertase Pin-like site-specific DNA recombinase
VIASEAAVKNRGGRPRVTAKAEQVQQLKSQGTSWRRIAKALGIGTATAMRLLRSIDGTRPNTQDVGPKT